MLVEFDNMPARAFLLLLFRLSAESSIAQERAPGCFTLWVTRVHLPRAIVVRLHVRKINVVILTPKMAVTVGI